MHRILQIVALTVFTLTYSCSNAGFSSSSRGKAAESNTAEPAKTDAGTATTPPPAAPGTDNASAAPGAAPVSTDGANAAAQPAPPPAPAPAQPTGPGSDLTLVITDSDSKLDTFQVRNSVTKAWIPLTWKNGTQTIPGGCSPQSKTILSLQMRTKDSIFGAGQDLVIGSCSAPVTQKDPQTVDVGVNPGCSLFRADFALSCAGSTGLQVIP